MHINVKRKYIFDNSYKKYFGSKNCFVKFINKHINFFKAQK